MGRRPDLLTMDPRDVRLSIAVMYAPWNDRRVEVAELLRSRLSDAPGVESFSMVEASRDESVWETSERAWQRALGGSSTHHVVLQDDIAICRGFATGLREAIAEVPDKVIAPFAVYKTIEEARERGVSWARVRAGLWGQATIIPKPDISRFLYWQDHRFDPDDPHDDSRVNCWAALDRDEDIWCTAPSLVEHLGANDSELGNAPPIKRDARWFIGENYDITGWDWSFDIEDVPVNRNKNVESAYSESLR